MPNGGYGFGNSASHRVPKRPRVRVVLSCGHSLLMRDRPFNGQQVFACIQGLGCGYQLHWVSWDDTEHNTSDTNPLYGPEG